MIWASRAHTISGVDTTSARSAAATAVSQFSLNDMAREFIEQKLLHWGIEDKDRATIIMQGEKIQSESNKLINQGTYIESR